VSASENKRTEGQRESGRGRGERKERKEDRHYIFVKLNRGGLGQWLVEEKITRPKPNEQFELGGRGGTLVE
jgi:hypothetical protein